MRNAFIRELIAAAEVNEKIMLVVGDLGYGVVEPFAKRFPNQFINAGIAEQNMMSVSAGLASEGFHVFVYSIANFPTFRCAEQIRNDVDYHNLSVTIVSVGGGLAYGNLGYSHHAVQDYALMRTLPNMLIASPGDPMEVAACMRYLLLNPTPSYLRLGKVGETNMHKEIPEVKPGVWLPLSVQCTNTRAILTTGATLEMAQNYIINNSISNYDLYSMPLWGIQEKRIQSTQIKPYTEIISVEDHLEDAGFGSWLLEASASIENNATRVKICGLNSSVCGMVGKQALLNKLGGLDLSKFVNLFN
jgi:transketolase